MTLENIQKKLNKRLLKRKNKFKVQFCFTPKDTRDIYDLKQFKDEQLSKDRIRSKRPKKNKIIVKSFY